MIKKFPINIHKQTSSYIHALYDPRAVLPFYAGRGVGDRVFNHFKSSYNKEVEKKISSPRN